MQTISEKLIKLLDIVHFKIADMEDGQKLLADISDFIHNAETSHKADNKVYIVTRRDEYMWATSERIVGVFASEEMAKTYFESETKNHQVKSNGTISYHWNCHYLNR